MIKLVLCKKEIVNGKSKFNRYFTFMNLPEEWGGEEHQHGVTVKFVKDLDLPKFSARGIITIEDENNDISAPKLYQVRKDDQNNDVYPEIWIRKFKSYKPLISKGKKVTQSMFVVDEEETDEVEFEG